MLERCWRHLRSREEYRVVSWKRGNLFKTVESDFALNYCCQSSKNSSRDSVTGEESLMFKTWYK